MAERCEQCLTEGITLLPMRWGRMFEQKALVLNSKLRSRLLREGYVYILDDTDKWYGYVVTEGRYLKDFTVTGVSDTPPYANEPNLPYKDSTCLKGGNCTALNSFIRIANPNKEIETLWCAYSPVKWTKEVLDRHKNNTDGAKTNNMIEVPVSATQSKSAVSISAKSQSAGKYDSWMRHDDGEETSTYYYGGEYLKDIIHPLTKQPYSPDKTNEQAALSKALIKIEEEGSRVLSLHFEDVMGQLIDLNEMMIDVEQHFSRKFIESFEESPTKVFQKAKIADVFENIRVAINKNAISEAPEFAKTKRTEMMNWKSYADGMRTLPTVQELSKKYVNEQLSDIDDMVNLNSLRSWKLQYESIVKANTKEKTNILDKLSEIYYYTLYSKQLQNQMTHNFDNTNMQSCVDYTLTVQEFIGSSNNYSNIVKAFDIMLSFSSLSNPQNYLGRAMVFNNPQLITQIDTHIMDNNISYSDMITLSWSSVAAELLEGPRKRYIDMLGKLQTEITLAEIVLPAYVKTRELSSQIGYAGVAIGKSDFLMGFFAGKKVAVVSVEGTIIDYAKSIKGVLQNEMANVSTKAKVSGNMISKAVDNFVKSINETDVNIQKNITTKSVIFVDISEVETAKISYQTTLEKLGLEYSKNKVESTRKEAKSTQSIAKSGARNTLASDIAQNALVDSRTLSALELQTYFKSRSGVKGYFKGNFLTSSLQLLACISLWRSIGQSDTLIAKSQAYAKFAASSMMFVGGIIQYASGVYELQVKMVDAQLSVTKTLDTATKTHLDVTKNVAKKSVSKYLVGARVLNIGGAVIIGISDGYDSMESFDRGATVLGRLQVGSAVTGIGSGILLGLGWVPVAGWILLGSSLIIGVAIAIYKRTPLQEWLEYGTWGKEQEKYNWTLKYEIDQLETVLKGESPQLKPAKVK